MGRSPFVGGRSAAGGRRGWVVAGDGPPLPQGPALITWCVRQARGEIGLGGSAGIREGMLAGLAPLRASTPWPAVGPGPDVAELRRARSCLSTTFSGCCPPDCRRPLHPV